MIFSSNNMYIKKKRLIYLFHVSKCYFNKTKKMTTIWGPMNRNSHIKSSIFIFQNVPIEVLYLHCIPML